MPAGSINQANGSKPNDGDGGSRGLPTHNDGAGKAAGTAAALPAPSELDIDMQLAIGVTNANINARRFLRPTECNCERGGMERLEEGECSFATPTQTSTLRMRAMFRDAYVPVRVSSMSPDPPATPSRVVVWSHTLESTAGPGYSPETSGVCGARAMPTACLRRAPRARGGDVNAGDAVPAHEGDAKQAASATHVGPPASGDWLTHFSLCAHDGGSPEPALRRPGTGSNTARLPPARPGRSAHTHRLNLYARIGVLSRCRPPRDGGSSGAASDGCGGGSETVGTGALAEDAGEPRGAWDAEWHHAARAALRDASGADEDVTEEDAPAWPGAACERGLASAGVSPGLLSSSSSSSSVSSLQSSVASAASTLASVTASASPSAASLTLGALARGRCQHVDKHAAHADCWWEAGEGPLGVDGIVWPALASDFARFDASEACGDANSVTNSPARGLDAADFDFAGAEGRGFLQFVGGYF